MNCSHSNGSVPQGNAFCHLCGTQLQPSAAIGANAVLPTRFTPRRGIVARANSGGDAPIGGGRPSGLGGLTRISLLGVVLFVSATGFLCGGEGNADIVGKIRDGEFIGVSRSQCTDSELQQVLKDDATLSFIEASIKRIEFGQHVLEPSAAYPVEIDLLNYVGQTAVREGLTEFLRRLTANSPVIAVADGLLTLAEGWKTYRALADALVDWDERALLFDYFQARERGETPQEALEDLIDTYEPVVNLVLRLRGLSKEEFGAYAEHAYQSWELANDQDKRQAIADVLISACMASRSSALQWRASPAWDGAFEGPTDDEARPWYDPEFDDSTWEPVVLPDSESIPVGADRFYRTSIEVADPHSFSLVSLHTDDGIWLYVNGELAGHWGGGWRRGGCVNDPLCPGSGKEVAPIKINDYLRKGLNVIAARVSNGVCCHSDFEFTISP